MTTKPKPVTLFGRKMRKLPVDTSTAHPGGESRYELRGFWIDHFYGCGWVGMTTELKEDDQHTKDCSTPHAAARALERKVEAQWKRLGKLMRKEGKR